MGYQKHYARLFRKLEAEFGALDEETIVAVVGFSAGGPANLSQKRSVGLYATCELSVYPEQITSAEGLNFELFTAGELEEDDARLLLTALGRLSMNASLGNGHTVDVSMLEIPDLKTVRLSLHSKAQIKGKPYGLYRCQAA